VDIPQERKVVTEIPGPRSRELFARRADAIPQGVANIHPIVTARASGAIIEDVDGNRLIDFATGIAVLNVGHTSPAVVEAAQRQLELDTHTCFHVTANEPYIALAERLNDLAPGGFAKKTMFANSGAEAVENAVKIARYHTKRPAVVVFDHAFHGRTVQAGLRAVRARGVQAAVRVPLPVPHRRDARDVRGFVPEIRGRRDAQTHR
jgi:4-aminobutyrate aminotransferase/(S)-3-amino-2-methylpropionate transaminase